jgi:hypothetical protein
MRTQSAQSGRLSSVGKTFESGTSAALSSCNRFNSCSHLRFSIRSIVSRVIARKLRIEYARIWESQHLVLAFLLKLLDNFSFDIVTLNEFGE